LVPVPGTVVIAAVVPVRLVLSVPVTVCVVPDVVLDVNVTVATPLPFVSDVAAPKLPPFVLPHVTVLPDVPTELLFASASCAVMVTLAPAVGDELDDVTRYLLAAPGTVVMAGVSPALPPVVAVTTCDVPDVAAAVKLTVAMPLALVLDVAELKLPPLVLDQVTTSLAVATELLFGSASCAVMVTVPPADGLLLDDETTYLEAAATSVVMAAVVPVSDALSVAVTVVLVPLTVCVTSVMVAVPLPLVVDVFAGLNEPLAFDLVHVTVRPLKATLLPFASRSCAVIVTLVPTVGLKELEVTE
jgi:hypothetical protein